MRTGGIYLIIHIATGRVYVGQSTSFSMRWKKHREDLALGTHHNYRLQELWSKDGATAFEFRPIHFLPDGLSPLERQRWLVRKEEETWEEYKSRDLALNIVRPEIVETPAAIAEYKIERKTIAKGITAEIRALKPQIDDAKKAAHAKYVAANKAQQEAEAAASLLKRNSGWRSFLFGKTVHATPEELKQLAAQKAAEMRAADEEKEKAAAEAQALAQKNKELYRSYPGNAERRLRRANLFSGTKRRTTIR